MGYVQNYGPELVMLGLQFSGSVVALTNRAALLEGMNPRVFVVYRQAIATLVIAPLAYLSRRKSGGSGLTIKSFSLIFLASLIGVTINQNFYLEGLYYASSSLASAMANLIPAVTFIMAAAVGLEKVYLKSVRSIAKILGTVLCVTGAISMVLLRGPKLLNAELLPASNSLFASDSGDKNWLTGCAFLFANAFCWSFWLILQVPVTASYPDHLSLSAWICFFATFQSLAFTLYVDRDPDSWYLSSYTQILSCVFAGIIGSAFQFFAQAWCISQRGPLFSAMFNPLQTVIVTILAAMFLREEIYIGSLIGAIGVIVGLYIVLWGKAKDHLKTEEETNPKLRHDSTHNVDDLMIQESAVKTSHESDLEEPLLLPKSCNCEENNINQC